MLKPRFHIKQVMPFVLLLLLILLSIDGAAQCNFSISGTINEEHTNEKLDFASLQILELNIITTTDSVGNFQFKNLCKGFYTLAYTHPGCKTEYQKINLEKNETLQLHLHHNEIDLNEVTIAQHKRESAPTQQVETLKDQTLFETRGMNLGDALKTLSGVSALKTGATIAKPVIHGMTGNRILLVSNGVRLESQQWGSEHAPEIDAYLAKKITVIKGASAIRYGSDAIGGVILIDPEALPSKPGIGAEFNYAVGSVNGQNDFSFLLQGNAKKQPAFSWRTQGTYRFGGNVHSPNYFQKNTGFNEGNGSVALGWKKEKYGFELFGSYFNTKIGILSAAHTGSLADLEAAIHASQPKESAEFSYTIGRPYQKVQHILSKLHSYLNTKKGVFALDITYQYNIRDEYDKYPPRNNTLAALNHPALRLEIQTITGEFSWEKKVKQWQNLAGAQFFTQTNSYKYGYLIPAFWNFAGGLFTVERWSNKKMEVELGARIDYRWTQAILVERGKKREPIYQYIIPTASLGLDYHITEKLKYNANIGLAWRAPSMSELFISGLHHSTATVEIGDEQLKAEQSLSITTGITYRNQWLHADVSLYSHLFKNYIYGKPDTQPILTIRGYFPVLRYVQTDAAISGSDINLAVFPIRQLELSAKASLLWAVNLKTKDWLEQMPSQRFNYSIRYTINGTKDFSNLYLALSVVHVLRQNLLPKNYADYLPAPKAYWLLNFDCGTTIPIKNQKISVGFTIQNMLNKTYREYMNRFRYFTDEPGINVMARIKIPLFFH